MLVLEVAKHTNFIRRVVTNAKGTIIVDLTKEGIEKSMGWSNHVIIFTQEDANRKYEEYNNKYRHSDFI